MISARLFDNFPVINKLLYTKIINSLPTKSSIYLPTDKIDIYEKLSGIRKVKQLYERDMDDIYVPKLKKLRQKYLNTNRCFIIGNGPSLNKTNLSHLKNEITFAVNSFFLKLDDLDWKPTFYVVEDHLVAEDRADQINRIDYSIKLFPAYLAYCLDNNNQTVFFRHLPRKSFPDGFDFSNDASVATYTGCTVTFTCMQLAFYFGFREIYLIGVDANYQIPADANNNNNYGVGVLDMNSDDPNHFHPDYFGKGYRWHDPQVDKMLEAYKVARQVTESNKVKIYNATVGGKLEVFDRIDYESLF